MFKLGKRPLPMIGRLSELLVSGHRAAGFFDATTTSPRSPLDLKMGSSSPRGLKNYDLGGVGLGIVATLEKSTHSGREILAKYAVCSQNLNRSDPIPVTSVHNRDGFSMGIQEFEDSMDENYTYVTCHGRNNGSVTKVYYDGGDLRRSSTGPNHGADLGACNNSNLGCGPVESVVFPTSDFLSSCHMCRKKLDGKDIYMYRGEKAFCSTECRAAQILMDERKEQCRLETSRSGDVASSSYSRDQIFFSAGILAI